MSLNTGLKCQGEIPINAESLNTSSLNRIRDKSCVLALDFNNDTSDRSSYGNHGINYGATFVGGKRGSALSFDGDDYVDCGIASALNFTTENFSIALWTNPTSITGNTYLINRGNWKVDGWYIDNNDGLIMLGISQAGAVQYIQTALSGYLVVGSWQFYVVVRNGATGEIYRNGVDVTLGTPSVNNPTTASRNLLIGAAAGGSAKYKGLIDEVRVYNRTLNVAEIQALYRELN